MASIFTYQEEPHRVHSPWSTPGSNTPQIAVQIQDNASNVQLNSRGCISKLEPEKHDGPIEYKLHLLLRWRRTFTYTSTKLPSKLDSRDRVMPTPAAARILSLPPAPRTYQPSQQTRQARLQQLTTQLLWRLQQSSPFHSSSNAKLILPILPEATPRLGVPDRPSKLLPGLEESQGALYEIGVADDGTLVGLADEELDESLTNLRAMAASLGCEVDVHRRVMVGDCEWIEHKDEEPLPMTKRSKLWVAEVLVRPANMDVEVVPKDETNGMPAFDLQTDLPVVRDERDKELLRMALVGASSSGKSSLLGTLTSSKLDNGRGKSRLSLLKHRHEIASGVTSSVAQELLGYQTGSNASNIVINYATGDVSSWPDIHNLADRLVFCSDSPGLPRYSKSAFRALISWKPAQVVLCIPADEPQDIPTQPSLTPTEDTVRADISLIYLQLCLRLEKPLVIAITKMDVATKMGLRQVLAKILSVVKAADRTPIIMNSPSAQTLLRDDSDLSLQLDSLVCAEQDQIAAKMLPMRADDRAAHGQVPIVLTSAVTGSGISSLHCMLRTMPLAQPAEETSTSGRIMFRTDEVFAIPPSKVYTSTATQDIRDTGVVLCGLVEHGPISVGDELTLGPFLHGLETDTEDEAKNFRRSSSHHGQPATSMLTRSLSENFSRSLSLHGRRSSEAYTEAEVVFARVKVVSLRNLRLSVLTMQSGDTGTVGVQQVDHTTSPISLSKARKGMVLASGIPPLVGHRSFVASFPSADFAGSASPPLILGGHAIAYIHSARAAVKVVAVALGDATTGQNESVHRTGHKKQASEDVFSFDSDEVLEDEESIDQTPQTLKITFKFVSTVEFLEVEDQVVIVPNSSMAGPVAGPTSTSSVAGLSGFVGKIAEVHA